MKVIAGVVLMALAALFALLSYYAFVESRSLPWGIGYAIAGVASVLSAAKLATSGRPPEGRD